MPTLTLTDKFIAALKPTGTRVEYFDTHINGLALRVSEYGKKTWTILYRTQPDEETGQVPRLRRLTLARYPDLTLKEARKRAEVERGKIAKGKDPAAAKKALRQEGARTGDTIADLAKDYIAKHAKVHKRSWEDDQRYLDVEVLPKWKAIKVKAITRRDVRTLIEGIADRGSPISANRCLSLVRKMFNFAIANDWIDGNPAALMQKPGAELSRDRVLSDAEIRWVWEACAGERPAMCTLMRLRLLTLQRGGELSAIKWTDIEGSWLTLPATITKNKKAHRVFLSTTAKTLIEALPKIAKCEYIFPGGRGENTHCSDHKKAGQRIAARVLATLQETDPTIGRFDFRGHDLRRTASTKMAEAGISQSDISKVLNHAEGGPKATNVYVRYAFDREKQIALETWDRVLTGVLTETGSTLLSFSARASTAKK